MGHNTKIMKTIEVTVYSFDELSDKAKEKVLRNFSDINVYFNWWEYTYLDAETVGLNIEGFDIDRRNIELEVYESVEDCCAKIIAEHGENCETYKVARNTLIALQGIEKDTDDYDYISSEFRRDISECYISILRDEYEYLTSEEAIIETIAANGYTFLGNGTQF